MNWQPLDICLENHPYKGSIYYIARSIGLHPILVHHLSLQGLNNSKKLRQFLWPDYGDLHDPFLLNDMDVGVDRILQAIARNELIFIFGDYDCDGITATAILHRTLEKMGARVLSKLPLREEGYGLSPKAIQRVPEGVSLLITVDNGSSAHPAMDAARKRGIDVIVTDHHDILAGHPYCLAFINPKRNDSTYPFPHLCGAGVALKVAHALALRTTPKDRWKWEIDDLWELAALGTITDVMPLVGENRVICSLGLHKMNTSPIPLFQVLEETLGLSEFDSTSIGFRIGPMFNASGRIDDPNRALAILLHHAPEKQHVRYLIQLNEQRKQMTQEQLQTAIGNIRALKLHEQPVIVVQSDFHHGIIGLLAARIADLYKKPAIVISKQGTGSARSVPGTQFSIIDVIHQCGEYLKKYGGHQAAAGLSINPARAHMKRFVEAIQIAAAKQKLHIPASSYIQELPIHLFPRELFLDIWRLEPFGLGNKRPVFYSRDTYARGGALFGSNKEHAQFRFASYTAFAYQKADMFHHWRQGRKMDILYTVNDYWKEDFLVQEFCPSPYQT